MMVTVYINEGNDNIESYHVEVLPGTSIMDSLKQVAEIEFTPDESATDHKGAMVTSINGKRNDVNRCWIYYTFKKGESGWRIPKEMPDKLEISEDMRIGWRYYSLADMEEKTMTGPLWTNRCLSKTRICSRKFS